MKSLQKFEIPQIVSFKNNESGLAKMIVTNDFAEAEIYLYGGNLTHFQPKGEGPVIFNGKETVMYPDKTLHAGIPICWPWFGPHPDDAAKPQHGFARTRLWEVKGTEQLANGETRAVLGLQEDEESLKLFPHPFELELVFTIGKRLRIELISYNNGDLPFSITQALHSYLSVSDIEEIVVNGLEETPFIDLTDENREKSEATPLRINKVINRVYGPTDKRCEIVDDGLHRKLVIGKEGSNSTTVWNPWSENGLHDLPGEQYRKFICIETVNALKDMITLAPKSSHAIVQEISVVK
jgi:glucose-6-phosphate 1-epimerase